MVQVGTAPPGPRGAIYIYISILIYSMCFRTHIGVEALYLKARKDRSAFVAVPLGQHTIEKYFRDSMTKCGKNTLHSLRRTGATRMFENNVPTQIIKMVSLNCAFELIIYF